MSLVKVFDASDQIPTTMPPTCHGVLGYIGGRAEHVWTVAEWNRFATVGNEVRLFPCWVADFSRSPVTSALDAAHAAFTRGWSRGRAIVLDTEAAVDRAWVSSWAVELDRTGFIDVNYGSASVVAKNGCPRLWVAAWDNDPVLEGGQAVEAHQYATNVSTAGGVVDLSVVGPVLWPLGGYGKRR
jgi:hypothetical protein